MYMWYLKNKPPNLIEIEEWWLLEDGGREVGEGGDGEM